MSLTIEQKTGILDILIDGLEDLKAPLLRAQAEVLPEDIRDFSWLTFAIQKLREVISEYDSEREYLAGLK